MRRALMMAAFLLACFQGWSETAAKNAPAQGATDAPKTRLTVEDAIRLARANAPQFRAATTQAALAREDRLQARAALLPSVSYSTGAIYTQPNGTPSGVFIGANGIREYVSQGIVREGLSFTSVAEYRRARYLEALGRANAEMAARGLVRAVIQNFYLAVAASRKVGSAEQAAQEANRFLTLSQQLERGGEVAHSDVIKARLQSNDRNRDLQQAWLAEEKARLDLAVLVFPDFVSNIQLVDDLQQTPPLPEFPRVQELAGRNNPAIAAAVANEKGAEQEVASAVGGHLPSLSFNYAYGIDANRYAANIGGTRNLGYQITATLDLPVFNWGATQSKVKQARLKRELARVELSAAHRRLLADLQQFYSEARSARVELALLQQSVALAGESLRLTTLRYQSGEATALEVVDAQNALTQARNDYDDGAVRYRVALSSLQMLTGAF